MAGASDLTSAAYFSAEHWRRTELSEPNPVKWRQWASYATTLLLVLIVIVTGTAAYNAREQWWDQYLSFIRR